MIKVSAQSSRILLRNSSQSKSGLTSGAASILRKIYQYLLNNVVNKPDIKIWKETNQNGDINWRVYDPMSGQTSYFCSEAEVRTWLEQRYYQQ